MATDKEVLQKLYKIARNQQKIIQKLAEEVGAVPAATAPHDQIKKAVCDQVNRALGSNCTVDSIIITPIDQRHIAIDVTGVPTVPTDPAKLKQIRSFISNAVMNASMGTAIATKVSLNGTELVA